MITQLRSHKFISFEGHEMWLHPKVAVVGTRLQIKPDQIRTVYQVSDNDFMSDGLADGEAGSLRSVTIILPGGEVDVINDRLDEPRRWEGSLLPIVNGIHVKANVKLRGIKPSVMHCIAPRDNTGGFSTKNLKRVQINAGQSYQFTENIIGFVTVYGPEPFVAYTAEPGDIYTAEVDTVLAVITTKGSVS